MVENNPGDSPCSTHKNRTVIIIWMMINVQKKLQNWP